MKKSLFLVIFAVFLVCSIALIGCTPEELENLDNLTGGEGVDTPFEAYNYFIDSIAKLLVSSETIEIESSYYEDDEEVDSEIIYQKSNEIISAPNAYISPKAYYEGKMYFRENFSSFATTSLKQFILASFFRSQYELETFLFADTVTFTEEGEGHKLVVVIKLTPHLYSYELITDANDSFVSVKLTNTTEWFEREARLNTKALSGVLPSAETLLLSTNDESSLWQNAATLSSAVYLYSQNPELKKQAYTSPDGSGYSLTPTETYNFNDSEVLFTDDNGGYGYYINNNFYTYDTEAETTYYEKTYTEDVGIYFCKYFMVWDMFWPLFDLESNGLTITENSPEAGKTKYVTDDYTYILSASGIEEFIYYNEYSEPAYTKYILSTEADAISAPAGFNSDAFLSDNQVSVIQSVDTALTQCNNAIDALNEGEFINAEGLRDAMSLNYTPPVANVYPADYTERTMYVVVDNVDNISNIIAIVYGENGYYIKGMIGTGSLFEYQEYTGL